MSDVLRDLAMAKVAFQLRAIEAIINAPASGMEARSGETVGLDPKDDSPTAESGDAHD